MKENQVAKILLLPDRLDDWSCHNRAKALKRHLTQHQIEIKSGEDLIAGAKDELRTLLPQFDIIHFLYSSGVLSWLPIVEKYSTLTFLGSAIGHRWHSCGPDEDHLPETIQTIKFMKQMKCVVALSESLMDRCLKDGINNVVFIPNGVEPSIFPYKRRLHVGHVGVLFTAPTGDYKGGDLVRSACNRLGFEFSTPGCYGPDRGPQQPGQRSQSKMVDWYKTIDVLCQPSSGEGCSNPIMEALSMNIRVVCTKEACLERLHPYVTLCTRDLDDICSKLDTSSLIPTWEQIAKQYSDFYDQF